MAAPTHLLDAADALVLATICTHLDPPGLQAVARAIRAIGNLASLELQRKAIKMLQDYDPDEREDGMLMLKRLGATTRAAIAPTVVQLFEHRHCCVRISAVLALTLLVDASALAAYAPALLDLLDDSYLETCEGALSALKLIDVAALAGKVGNVADEVLGAHEAWTDRMGDELDTRESVHAMRLLELAVTLDHKKMSGRITEVLTSVIYEPDEEVRQAAHSVLARFDAPTRNGLRHILTELFLAHENEAQIQEAAVSAFGLLEGEALAAAAPFMVSVANNLKCSTPTRKMALSMLAKLEPQALAAQAKALLFMLHCGSTVLQCAAAVTLGHLSGEGLAEHAPAMRAMIQYGPEPELLLSACKGMQPKVLEAIAPALVPIALNYSTSRTRTLIVSLLTLLEPSALDVYAPLLLSMLRDDVSCVRSAAMSALRGLTEDGKRRHQAAFLAMLDNTTGDVRADVVWALDCVLSPHELAQHSRLLVALAGDRDPYVRASALRAMSSLEPADLAPHAEITVRALRSPSEHERWRALEGLKALGQGSSNTVSLEPFLAQLVSSPEPWQHESLGLRYIRTSKQHQRNPHACQAAVTVGRLVTASTASRIRNHKRRGRRWLV